MEQSFRTNSLPVAISYGLTHDPQLLEPCLCNKQHLESCLNIHLSFQLLQESSKTLPSANTEETFPCRETQSMAPLTLSLPEMSSGLTWRQVIPPNIKMTLLTSKPDGSFLSHASCVAAAKESLSKESSFIDLIGNIIWEICHQHSPLPQTSNKKKMSDHSQTVSTSMGLISVDFTMSFLSCHLFVLLLITQTQTNPPSVVPKVPRSHTATQVRHTRRLFQGLKPTGALRLID